MLRSTELVGRVVGGRYRLLRAVGSGASAHVYVAEDIRLRRRVAIKVLHPALAQDRAFQLRFQAEAQTVAALRHPSILRVYDWGEDHGESYLVMELLEGGSLRSLLDTGARLSVSQAAAVGLDVASALAHAHSRGLVHRDIKPANLLFDEDGHVSVADFGIARALAEASWTEPWGAMVGTARYAAPEQLRAVPLDGRADVYALSMVLVEAVTGTVPFSLDTTLGALIARAGRPLPVPPELGTLGPVLAQAGAADPEERLAAEGLAQAIARVATSLRAPARLELPGLARSADGPDVQDRTEMGFRAPMPDDAGLSILAQDLPPVVLPAPPDQAPEVVEQAGEEGIASVAVGRAETETETETEPDADVGARAEASRPRQAKRRRLRRWLTGLAVLVVLALLGGGGTAAYIVLTQPPPTYAVPHLAGDMLGAARAEASRHHLAVAVVGGGAWSSAPKGSIISQQPPPGARRQARQTIYVTLSKGPQPVTVPSLATLTVAQAKSALLSAGLSLGKQVKHPSMTVPQGIVISWSSDGQHLLPGAAVNVVISSGKPMVAVPPIGATTATWALMSAALTHARLVPHESTVYSSSVSDGDVISTYPAGGILEVVGTGVTVTVSMGPHMVTIPATIVGQPVNQAASTLQQAGLYTSERVDGSLFAPVSGTIPAVGASVPYKSTVILVTG